MRLGIIGCGKMGRALLEGVLDAKLVGPKDVMAFDSYGPSMKAVSEELGVGPCSNAEALSKDSDVILLCVKPLDLIPLLEALGEAVEGKLLISIAAGVKISTMEKAVPRARVVRVMPNTPALVGRGASAFAVGDSASTDDGQIAAKLLGSVGVVREVPEKLLDAVTGLSGSGPAYVYTVIEALADGGVRMGLSKVDALALAAQTVAGAAEMVLQTGEHPAVLRDQVTSPGGTTIAGLATLEEKGMRSALIEAVKVATERSAELGGE